MCDSSDTMDRDQSWVNRIRILNLDVAINYKVVVKGYSRTVFESKRSKRHVSVTRIVYINTDLASRRNS